jgi:hypothetical protein
VEMCGLDASGSRQGSMASSCEHGNEPPGSIKGGEFLEYPSYYLLLKNDSAPLS